MLNIWIIDDEEELTSVFIALLEQPGVNFKPFYHPNDAINQLQVEKAPDLIFIDYRLPSMSGIELAKKFPESTVKVLMTGEPDDNFNYHFHKIMHKPYDFQEVELFLANFIKK